MTHLYHQLPRRHQQLLIAVSVLTGILILLPSDDAKASKSSSTDALEVAKRYEAPIDLSNSKLPTQAVFTPAPKTQLTPEKIKEVAEQQQTEPQPAEQQTLAWQQVKVKSGDNLALIFSRAGFSANTLHKITSLGKATATLKRIMPGQVIHFGADKDDQLVKLRYQQDIVNTLEVVKTEQGYTTNTITKELEIREQVASATISSNFWNAGVEAGLEPSLIMKLANIFGWDIDFGLDIRQGDHFNIIYETKYLNGEQVKTGNILAAEFVNQDQSYKAIRHSDGEYYSETGRSMRKAFLRAPVNFKYISSSFNPRRRHPVTGRVKAHNGIDYAAKTGTPVSAAGSGTVIKSGYTKYNGNYIFIKHGEKYITKYLHLSKKFVRKGAKVKQGQRIGNVGATGQVTGAHLHYEFLVNGVHRNPRTVKLPKSQSIAKKEKPQFLEIAAQRLAQLNATSVLVASNDK